MEEPGRPIDGVKAALAAAPVDLARLLEGHSRERLAQPANDGGWGIVEIIPHIRDWEDVTHDRVWAILSAHQPELEDFDDSLWAIEHDYSSLDPFTTLDEFRTLREALVARIDEIGDEDWQRTAVFPKHGVVTLHWLLNRVCDHDAKHVLQSREVLA